MSKIHKQKPVKHRNEAGYTLVELLVVMLILGLLIGLVAPRFMNQVGGAKSKTARIQVENLASAIEFFRLDTGYYPNTSNGLEALVSAPPDASGWNGPYVKRVPNDPWREPYVYELTGSNQFTIRTLGADKKAGGEGENEDYVSGS
ncbi:hypothetical protein MNBD_ALPHA06-2216 [hydrothermal vent metagenome]|uniref:Type II secretion system core protein G n=1 Tax=hydrothermal vent metagenome TaxID=652676 RepID=A0A3B0RB54_9ZZZZ